ncbi:acyltransferase [Flavimarina sp. Hel_I_48]|uniref:LuxE/PaaK family acyltransferase n=1 Tax=Flavimarina sp. Hel_I_48 TaxID=1392488 RepID=UPI0004DED709|nr:acyltransferase [Flavimarina sp. Hel_I_48]
MQNIPFYEITTVDAFKQAALQVFRKQYSTNDTYRKFCGLLSIKKEEIRLVEQIPFMPISFFKEHEVLSSSQPVQTVFSSSGTTGSTTSKHFVTDLSLYEASFTECFSQHYGPVTDYTVLALLPSYLERTGSSLIYMVDHFIAHSKKPESGFYLNDLEKLAKTLKKLDEKGEKTLLIGVSFALLDLVEKYEFQLKNTLVMETGGMKGRRKEMVREELHELLQKGFGVNQIHSEYGMTELLSQGYSNGDGIFTTPPWMDIQIRDTEDALSSVALGKTGGINVIDLANVNSCAFIATQDLGRKLDGNRFEVLGRFDTSDIRGCNLMVL